MQSILRLITVFATIIMLAAGTADAHLRDYLVTKPYWTAPKGGFEIEFYNDFYDKNDNTSVFANQTELEYGLTDRLTVGVYAVFEKQENQSTNYAETKFETRYRLAEPGRCFVDPAIYLEYQHGAGNNVDSVEAKLLLSKDLPNGFNITLNGILEREREAGSDWEKGVALGVSKWISPKLTTGIEYKGGEGKGYIIPGAYINIGHATRFNIGAVFGLTEKSDDFQIRTITEFELF